MIQQRWMRKCLGLWALLGLAGCASWPGVWQGPDPLAWRSVASEREQFAVFREVMARPARVSALADHLQQGAARAAAQGHDGTSTPPEQATSVLWSLLRGLSSRARDAQVVDVPQGPGMRGERGGVDGATEQALQSLPTALGDAVRVQLLAMLQAQRWLDRALAEVPQEFTRQEVLSGRVDAVQLAHASARVDLPALGQGIQVLIDATAQLKAVVEALAQAQQLPAVRWQHQTEWGWVHVDTTGASQSYAPEDVWLWLKVGGDDRYGLDAFHGASDRRAVRVLLDTGGDDVYSSDAAGADAAAGVLGLGLLWDGQGHDRWQCSRWCQAAGLLGAGVLVNERGGQDEFKAQSQAQAHAVGGLALLASNMGGAGEGAFAQGHTVYTALNDAQGSAGPSGVAGLVDAVGDDRYELAPWPLVAASAQLPDRNSSMGQGAGRGWWGGAAGREGLRTAGGVGVLLDLQGNDHYRAQVFAQGAGYQEGLGVLVDGGGDNRFEAAWYALGAAAHGGAGILVASGGGDDVYRVSHVTSLGAGHDAALGWFEDRAGHDVYALSDVGFGVGLDGGVGVFIDTVGQNCFAVSGSLQRVRGQSIWLQRPERRKLREGLGVFRARESEGRCESSR